MSWLFNNKYLSKKQFSSTYLISILMHYSVKWIIFEFVTNCQSVCCFNHLSHQTAMDICQWPHTNAKREVSHGKIHLCSIIVSLLSLHWPLTLLHLLSLWEAYTTEKAVCQNWRHKFLFDCTMSQDIKLTNLTLSSCAVISTAPLANESITGLSNLVTCEMHACHFYWQRTTEKEA